jgi:hydrophobe/amphiphile efflux-1 (HAE1) family protein
MDAPQPEKHPSRTRDNASPPGRMNLSAPFIKRPAGTSLLAIGLFLLGIVAYHFMPVAPTPRVDNAVVNVSASLPGADPDTVASSLAAPLERHLAQIAGVTEITSSSSLGGCSITVQFDLNRKVDGAARDVQAAISAATADLPINLPGPPTYRKINPADAPIMVLAMKSSTLPSTKIFEYADTIIAQRLSQVEGVSQAFVGGADKSAIRIQVNPTALAATGTSLEEVRNMINLVNANQPKGSLESEHHTYIIDCNDQVRSAADYKNLILTQRKGVPLRLNSIGEAIDSVENRRVAGWAGTNRAVLIIIQKQAGANVIDTVGRIRAVLPQIQKWIPPSITISEVSNRTTTIRASVHDVQFSLCLSIALVVMVLFLFLRRITPTFIAGITVPLALTGTFAIMYLFNYSIDNLSLMAVTISVGFVVDDAIVVIENIHRFIEKGQSSREAAINGAKQIGFTVVSMSTSLVAVFIPLLFMPGPVGKLFNEFAVTVSIAILVSGVISLTLTPMLCSRLLKPESEYAHKPGFFSKACEAAFNGMHAYYAMGLRWVLRNFILVLAITFMTIVGTIGLYIIVPKGFFPQQDTGSLMVTTDAAQDISFQAMAELQQQAARIILADPGVQTLGSFLGSGPGGGTVNNGRMFVTLKPLEQRKVSAFQIISRLRKPLSQLVGINVFIQVPQDIRSGGRMSKSQFQYSLQSSDTDELKYQSGILLNKLQQLPQLKDVNTDQQSRGLETYIEINREAASRLGISPISIDNTLYDAFGQRQVSTLYEQYNQHHVIMEATPGMLEDPSALRRIYVKSNTGRQIPLEAVARFSTTNTSLSISHQSQFPCVTLSFNLADNVAPGDAAALVNKVVESMHLPSSVRGGFQGTAQAFQTSNAQMPILIIAALATIYIVLGMLYESLLHPITIISTLPSAGVGALLAILATGYDLSIVAFIGIMLLMGIVKKNAIMMIDFALEVERHEGLSPRDAIYKACLIRFRPIMMTTMAAFFGAVPLAIGMGVGSELRQPLGIAVVGGLIFSQVLTLFTTPVVYLTLESLKQYLKVWWQRSHAVHTAPQTQARPQTTPSSNAAS